MFHTNSSNKIDSTDRIHLVVGISGILILQIAESWCEAQRKGWITPRATSYNYFTIITKNHAEQPITAIGNSHLHLYGLFEGMEVCVVWEGWDYFHPFPIVVNVLLSW